MKHGYLYYLHTVPDKGFFKWYFSAVNTVSHVKSPLFQLNIYGYYKFKDFVSRTKISNNVLFS